jgi:hypothetical protein
MGTSWIRSPNEAVSGSVSLILVALTLFHSWRASVSHVIRYRTQEYIDLLPAAIGQTMELAQTHNHFTPSLLISSYWSAVAIGLEAMVGFLRCDFYPFIMPVRGRVFFQAHFYLSFTRCMPLRSYLTCFRLFIACNKKATVGQIPAAGEAVGWPQSLNQNSHRPIWAPRDVPFDLLGYAKLICQTPKTPLFIVLYRRFPWLQVQLSVANFSWTFVSL